MVERARRNAPPLAPIPVPARTESRRHRILPYLLEFVVVVLGVTGSFGLDGWRHDRQQARRHDAAPSAPVELQRPLEEGRSDVIARGPTGTRPC